MQLSIHENATRSAISGGVAAKRLLPRSGECSRLGEAARADDADMHDSQPFS